MTAVILTSAPAFSSFNLDYVVRGRIWVPVLSVDRDGVASTDLAVALSGFGGCEEHQARREQLLEPQEHDCRFERQLGDVLATSGLFRRAARAPLQGEEDVDLILSPRLSRVQFRREVIPEVKPLVILSFFAYLWTPLPFEMDVESYDLRLAILDRAGQPLSEVSVAQEFGHYLSSYSAERSPPDDLLAQLDPTERELGPIIVCRGPHAHLAVRELLRQLSSAMRSMKGRVLSHVAETPPKA